MRLIKVIGNFQGAPGLREGVRNRFTRKLLFTDRGRNNKKNIDYAKWKPRATWATIRQQRQAWRRDWLISIPCHVLQS